MKLMKSLLAVAVLMPSLALADEVQFDDLHASSFKVGARSAESRSGSALGLDWSVNENFAIQANVFNFTDEEFSTIAVPDDVEFEDGSVRRRMGGVDYDYGVKLQHVFYDALSTPISAYITVGQTRLTYDEIVLEEADSNGSSADGTTTTNNDDGQSFSLAKIDSLYYGVGTRWFVNNRTSFDFSYIVYDDDERGSGNASTGGLKASLQYAPVKNFGFAIDYIDADVIGNRAVTMSIFARW